MKNSSDHAYYFNCTQLPGYQQTFQRSETYEYSLLVILILNSITALLVICSNVLVIYIITTTRSLYSPSYFLILGLAISDLWVGILSQPSFSAIQYFELIEVAEPYCVAAVVYQFSGWFLASISLLTLTVLTTDRFLALHFHLRYQEFVTCTRVVLVLVIIWIYGILAGIFRIFTTDKIFTVHILILIGAILLNIIFLCKINQTVRRHSAQIQALQAQPSMNIRMKKSVNIVYYIIGTFVLCFFPYVGCSVAIVIIQTWTQTIRILFRAAEFFALTNSLLNPIIYCWRIEDMRNAVRQRFQSIFITSPSANQ
ncbi:G-protein coupled receptor 12-like [Exaiptasia diaphana]|uniref:G-protein coupled receptors family 1 profile domain-containing protein n=1 Tax=Exaiptasia diaphana TaxID=2652724 RepID=A0A913YPE3_EXADI|nr:G-protein coupled receptor 12-like [Exaiptasia diaphana]